jgi:hypothetical protein
MLNVYIEAGSSYLVGCSAQWWRGSGRAPPVSENDCPESHPVKGNQDSGIYHPSSGGSYSVANPEVCFASPGAAEGAGYRAGHGHYRSAAW